jgi:hypothetical protein
MTLRADGVRGLACSFEGADKVEPLTRRALTPIARVCSLAVLLVMACSETAQACEACYGKTDSPLAQGMNWGIYTLLACIGVVLMGFAGISVIIVRRANAHPVMPESKADQTNL